LSYDNKFGNDRLTKACQRALGYGTYNYKTIQNILEKNLDSDTDTDEPLEPLMPDHENIRGENYYK
jgi:hypothetical protein